MGYLQEPKWQNLEKVLKRPGAFLNPDDGYAWDEQKSFIDERGKILVIGAGGLGCEILKDLALSGFKDIHVIDMDTIDISNLNRQFLFRESDVGEPKADVAARFVMRRVPGCTITPYYGKIQDKDEDYYKQFTLVICGLDSVEARRWINATLVEMATGEAESIIPLIDGGTEGFKGQSRIIIPTQTSCYECSLDMLTPQTAVPICTLASIPRQPAHCIEWASILEWPRVFGDRKLDTDSPEDIQWLYTTALTRAAEFNIPGVTYQLTQGVVKNIIPAIASTNAVIAASCCNEALKIMTNGNPWMSNYMMYTGDGGIYTHTFEHEKKEGCPVCGTSEVTVEMRKEQTLQELIEELARKPDTQLKRPTIALGTKGLYYQAPPMLEERTRPNLEKKLEELVVDGDELNVTDPSLPSSMTVKIKFT